MLVAIKWEVNRSWHIHVLWCVCMCALWSSIFVFNRPLVAAFAKINPPGKPSSFCGHIKLQRTQMRRETVLCYIELSTHKLICILPLKSLCPLIGLYICFQRDSVSTSRGSQPNTLEYEMAMAWCLHRARSDHAFQTFIEVLNFDRNVLQCASVCVCIFF